jgi:Uma2 family endonuclease
MRWQENVEQTLTEKKSCIHFIIESVSPTQKDRERLYFRYFSTQVIL